MALSIVRFQKGTRVDWGVRLEERIYPLNLGEQSLAGFLDKGTDLIGKIRGNRRGFEFIPETDVALLSPITSPCRIICQGMNYADHIVETGGSAKGSLKNILFSKADSSLCVPRGTIRRPPGVRLLDYELELGLVIGKPILKSRKYSEDELHEAIAGVFMANDVSARDIQIPEVQWFRGKSFRTFCPAGPYLCLLERDEFHYLSDLDLDLKVNGEARQRATTSQLIHKPAATLSLISELMELHPGDVILTGTPSGVALQIPRGFLPKLAQAFLPVETRESLFLRTQVRSDRYLKNGDKILSTIRSRDGRIDLGMQELTVIE